MPGVKRTHKNVEKNSQQASRGTASTATKGFKRVPEELIEWIEMANLIPRGQAVPEVFTGLDWNSTGAWPEVLERIARLDDPLRSFLLAHSEPGQPDFARLFLTHEHYVRVQLAGLLRFLVRPDPAQYTDTFDRLVRALRQADLKYLRECEYEHCGQVFYASRHSQRGHNTAHANAIRKKRKRDKDKENRKLKQELNERKKRASKRRTSAR